MVGVFLLLVTALGSPGAFALVNGTGAPLTNLSIRPADGKQGWRPLAGPLSSGARMSVPAPGGDLCAFDLKARLADADVTWSSVNLCDVRSVTLNRQSDGTLWVDYD